MGGVSAGAPANLNNIIIVGIAAAGILLALGYWFLQKRTLANKKEMVEIRKAEAQKLEAIIAEVEAFQKRKDNLQSRIDLINQLKQNQKGPVRIMDRISQDLPDLVWLDNLSVEGGKITVKGRGLNPNAIANFVENVKNDPYFEEPELQNVTEASITPLVYSFDMNFGFSYQPKTPGGPGAPGAPAAATTTGGAAAPAGTAR
jgi:type IV pilus assembly protein PilN